MGLNSVWSRLGLRKTCKLMKLCYNRPMLKLKILLSFLILMSIKLLGRIFYSYKLEIFNKESYQNWKDINLMVLLNHTSLYEPLLIGAAPTSLVWQISKRMIAPGADVTLDRPLVGAFYKLFARKMVSITRKRDESWSEFLKLIEQNDMTVIAAEGRMLRKGGVDKHGNPMTIRGGVADIMDKYHSGDMVIFYSGGLHHVHYPGEHFPKLFKEIKVGADIFNIEDFKRSLNYRDKKSFTMAVVRRLEEMKKERLSLLEKL